MSNPLLHDIELVLITGISGSGKSVAVAALEDAGYYCVDNLPPELLHPLVELQATHGLQKIAVAIDVRSALSLPALPAQLFKLKTLGVRCNTVYLETTTEVLMRRFSETRRQHPLSRQDTQTDERRALIEAIRAERDLLADLRDQAMVIDTSHFKAAELRTHIQAALAVRRDQLTLVFESFAFKRGLPMDADFVFDVRMLPNPHYDPALRSLTGRDAPVAQYLAAQDSVAAMQNHIQQFLDHWLAEMQANHRSYVTVAIGCTGGQHRSVYLVEQLFAHYTPHWHTQLRHRMLGALS
jgi:RNase adapter protein RapZ